MFSKSLGQPQPALPAEPSLADLRPASAPRPADPLQPARQAYYAAAGRWDTERIRAIEVSRNRAWLAVALCLLCLAALSFAIVKLALEHHVEVVTVAFDAQTNMVRHVNYSDQREQLTTNEAFIRNQIYQFVMNAETVDPLDSAKRRALVALTSDPETVQDQILGDMARAEAAPPTNAVRPRRIRTTVNVVSISMLNPLTAHVQFSTEDLFENRATATREWAVVIGFKFSSKPLTVQEAMVNPFGFQVTSYRKSATTN